MPGPTPAAQPPQSQGSANLCLTAPPPVGREGGKLVPTRAPPAGAAQLPQRPMVGGETRSVGRRREGGGGRRYGGGVRVAQD